MPVTKSLDVDLSLTSATSTPCSPNRSLTVNCSTKIPSHVLHSVSNMQTSPVNRQPADISGSTHYTPFNASHTLHSNTNTGFNTMDLLSKSYAFFFASFEKQWTQKLDQLAFRLEGYQREQAAMKFQINRLERVVQIFMEQVKPDENSKRHSLWTGSTPLLHSLSKLNSSTTFPTNPQSITNCNSLMEDVNMYRTKPDLNFCTPNIPLPSTTVFTENTTNAIPDRWYSNYPSTGRSDAAVIGLTRPFGGTSVNPYLFWHQWMLGLFGTTSSSSSDSTSTNCTITTVANATGKSATMSSTAESKHNSGSCSVSAAVFNRLQETHLNQCRTVGPDDTSSWPLHDYRRIPPSLSTQRPCKLTRLRGRRVRGSTRSVWSTLYAGARAAAMRRALPFSRSTREQMSNSENRLHCIDPYKASEVNLLNAMGSDGNINESPLPTLSSDLHARLHSNVHDVLAGCHRAGYFESTNLRVPTSHSASSKSSVLIGNPIVILNPKEPREIFIGGIPSVPLPLWAYKKCLTMVRGEPHELGPRLCLRLLQSLFSLHYLVTHNYNGSGGKAPIDPIVMGAVLRQAQIQFGSGYFFTEPMALGKLRDYLNNAFRVMAFRQRKGERVRSPFWNEQGEPVHGLEAPVEFAETSDVIVLTSEFSPDLVRPNETSGSTSTPNDVEFDEQNT